MWLPEVRLTFGLTASVTPWQEHVFFSMIFYVVNRFGLIHGLILLLIVIRKSLPLLFISREKVKVFHSKLILICGPTTMISKQCYDWLIPEFLKGSGFDPLGPIPKAKKGDSHELQGFCVGLEDTWTELGVFWRGNTGREWRMSRQSTVFNINWEITF